MSSGKGTVGHCQVASFDGALCQFPGFHLLAKHLLKTFGCCPVTVGYVYRLCMATTNQLLPSYLSPLTPSSPTPSPPGDPIMFPLSVEPANNFPIDLYLLMDLSFSMRDDLDNLKALGAQLGESTPPLPSPPHTHTHTQTHTQQSIYVQSFTHTHIHMHSCKNCWNFYKLCHWVWLFRGQAASPICECESRQT